MVEDTGLVNHLKATDILSKGMYHRLFPNHLEITPSLNEVYELALAFYESQILTDEELIENGAYFARVKNRFTKHYLMCMGEPVRLPRHSSSRLKSFFEKNQPPVCRGGFGKKSCEWLVDPGFGKGKSCRMS